MSTLFFMRHAESKANKARYLASQSDVSLTDEGAAAATEIAEEFMKQFKIEGIYASPQLRARQTAEPFSFLSSCNVIIDPALSEQHLGRFSGSTYKEAEDDPAFESDRSGPFLMLGRIGSQQNLVLPA